MRVTFYGVRGSISTPDVSQSRYGGNTPCVLVEVEGGPLLVLDGGLGLRWLSEDLTREARRSGAPIGLHLLLAHGHWDHIQGIPFAPMMYSPGNRVDIYGRRGMGEGLKTTLLHQMNPNYCPVPNFFLLDDVGATVAFHELDEEELEIGPARVLSLPLPRGVRAPCSGYRIEAHGRVVTYLTDVEYLAGGGPACPEALRLARGADLLIHDAQFLPEEARLRPNWGHSTWVDALALAEAAQVARLALFHHDPGRSDQEVDRIVAAASAQASMDVFAAAEGSTLTL